MKMIELTLKNVKTDTDLCICVDGQLDVEIFKSVIKPEVIITKEETV